MTPQARHAAAADILDAWLAGSPLEPALTNWARANRYAGSGDRAAVRDIVFDTVRRLRSCAAWGGVAEPEARVPALSPEQAPASSTAAVADAPSGRRLVLGLLRGAGQRPEAVFDGSRYGLAPLSPAERASGAAPRGHAQRDIPDWIAARLQADLGAEFDAVCAAFRDRAEVFLRIQQRRASLDSAAAALRADGIETEPHPLAATALRVTSGARRIRASGAFRAGLVDLQDASSQAVCAIPRIAPGTRVLDYCAGGGGKALALAARGATVFAHDADPARMTDLPARAARAQLEIAVLSEPEAVSQGPYDLVFVDAPCSGSGAWRRQAEAKWTLTPARLDHLVSLQAEILDRASALVTAGGTLAYATCSLLGCENGAQADAFVARGVAPSRRAWRVETQHTLSPLQGGDGFFLALFG